jgi:hypothetical protein
MGYVYIVEAQTFGRIKIGYWNSDKRSLRTRYVTPYGSDVVIHTFETSHPIVVEKVFKEEMKERNINLELYDVRFIEDYKNKMRFLASLSLEELQLRRCLDDPSDTDRVLNSIKWYLEIHKEFKGRTTIPYNTFDDSCVIDEVAYDDLRKVKYLSPKETLQRWIFIVTNDLWGVNRVDKKFYDEYIGKYEQRNLKKTYDLLCKAMRTRDLLDYTLDQNKAIYEAQLQSLLNSRKKSYSRLFMTNVSKYYNKLIEGAAIYNVVFPVANGKVKSMELERNLKAYLEGKSDSEYKSIIDVFGLDKDLYGDKNKTCDDTTKLYAFFKQTMNVAFEISMLVISRGTRHKGHENYNNKEIEVSFDSYNALKDKYDPLKLR